MNLQTFTCVACKREFESTREDVEAAAGHLCLGMDMGLSQHEALLLLASKSRTEAEGL